MDAFTVKIELGNGAMSNCIDVANALRDVANKVERGQFMGKIKDINGNTVGSWSI